MGTLKKLLLALMAGLLQVELQYACAWQLLFASKSHAWLAPACTVQSSAFSYSTVLELCAYTQVRVLAVPLCGV